MTVTERERQQKLPGGSLTTSVMTLTRLDHFNPGLLTIRLRRVAVEDGIRPRRRGTRDRSRRVLMAEICPTRVRGRAMSIATVSLWFGTFLGYTHFPFSCESAHSTWRFLVLRRGLSRRPSFCLARSSRDQGQNSGRNRKVLVE